MKTILYIDALNFYHGCLKNKGGNRYKWLDLMRLFQLLLPDHQIVRINYFTAIAAKKDKSARQRIYIRALEKRHPGTVRLHYGRFSQERIIMKNALPPPERCEVLRNKEKKTDVNLAVRLLDDAWTLPDDAYNCAVIVSNDSDLSGAMEVFKKRFPEKRLGLISPGVSAKTSSDLRAHADFVIKIIRQQELRNSQLPNPIPGTKIYKPDTW